MGFLSKIQRLNRKERKGKNTKGKETEVKSEGVKE